MIMCPEANFPFMKKPQASVKQPKQYDAHMCLGKKATATKCNVLTYWRD